MKKKLTAVEVKLVRKGSKKSVFEIENLSKNLLRKYIRKHIYIYIKAVKENKLTLNDLLYQERKPSKYLKELIINAYVADLLKKY